MCALKPIYTMSDSVCTRCEFPASHRTKAGIILNFAASSRSAWSFARSPMFNQNLATNFNSDECRCCE